MRFKNYINRYNKKNRIYSEEELLAMTLNDLLDNEPAILSQDSDIGIPNYEELRHSPNTRWIDSYTDNNGQKLGGFYGSINDYDESFISKQKYPPFVFNPNKPYFMSMDDAPVEEENEEEPIVLEGGVEENVYLPEEEEEDENADPNVNIPETEEPEEQQKSPYYLSDEDLADILQNILRSKISANFEKEPLLEDSFPNISETGVTNNYPVSLPQTQTSLNQEELKEMWEKLLEELRKMLAKYKGLSNMAKFQKVASKAPIYNEIENEYYRNSLKMKDGEPLTPKFIEENDVYNYQDITDPEKSNYYKEQLAKMYGLDVNAPDINEKLKDKKIVVPKETSRLYQYAMSSDAFQKWVSENYDKIKNGESYNDKITFPLQWNDVLDNSKRGMYATIHNANIKNTRVNPDGSITGNLVDPFNFEKWNDKLRMHDSNGNMRNPLKVWGYNKIARINNRAYEQQQANKLEPFYIDMPVIITNPNISKINHIKNK